MFYLSLNRQAEVLDIMARSGADNLCLFLFNSYSKKQALSFLCRYGMSERVHSSYIENLWAYDPFLSAVGGSQDYPAPMVLERAQLEEDSGRAQPYWKFIDQAGYRDIVAASHPFSPGMYLVGGLMEQRQKANPSALSSGSVLGSLEMLVNGVASDFMESLTAGFFENNNNASNQLSNLHLTPREMEVVQALQTGRSNKQIAAALTLSEFAVEKHFKRLFRKFKVNNRTALLAKLQSVGLLTRH
ncbi:helix-turn-helix transcriptional regulator [Spongiibacter sp. UBA1325]|jgi:DNA-binding CsgD family transcriptional regulator|uniref:helix-turn-helix transcriptional regulator n=1 Tax=Spongiibacter sp. UBA1325 TaxID=1947543 RepID=UPI00257E413E|nr:LuxR C-terminal-related transcriptional regulator [Spongiibacter sp. UBA1325]|tara:strand:+ start:7502 stop:8233 length:732 start_codon:yes stop_codon:yes gene_type:complete